jgi:hypothetical protein
VVVGCTGWLQYAVEEVCVGWGQVRREGVRQLLEEERGEEERGERREERGERRRGERRRGERRRGEEVKKR